VRTKNDHDVAEEARVEAGRWAVGLDEVMGRIASRFVRVEPRRRARAFLTGLLAGLPRSNCWTLAEHAGEATPDGMQHLLARAVWDHEQVAADLREYVVDHLGDPSGVLIVDETGDVKKGTRTVGVQRQYTGTAGRIENSQVAVYLTYATRRGYAFCDRALYLPKAWVGDSDRLAAAGVPADTGFATKPALATRMITTAVDAGVPVRWVTADEVYGADPTLRAEIIGHGLGYVLAVAKNHVVPLPIGPRRAADLAQRPDLTWHRLSAGTGAKGERLYDWAWITIPDTSTSTTTGAHGLLLRRNRRTGELAYYRTYTPTPVPLGELVRVAGTRWRVEEAFQSSKDLTGLDQHQVRTWTSWHRWTVLVMLAHAFLSVMTATQPTTTDPTLIPLTRNEIRRLFTDLIKPARSTVHQILAWSHWRRRHQARSRTAHHNRHERDHQ
jgi:SRSO17 transposase